MSRIAVWSLVLVALILVARMLIRLTRRGLRGRYTSDRRITVRRDKHGGKVAGRMKLDDPGEGKA